MDRARLEAMVQEASVDCYNETEQATGLFTMIEDHLDVPFETSVLGVTVTVASMDISVSSGRMNLLDRGSWGTRTIPSTRSCAPGSAKVSIRWPSTSFAPTDCWPITCPDGQGRRRADGHRVRIDAPKEARSDGYWTQCRQNALSRAPDRAVCLLLVHLRHSRGPAPAMRTSGAPRRAASAVRSSGWSCDSRSAATRAW